MVLYLTAPLALLRLAWRGLRSPDYWHRWPERFGVIRPALGERVIWIHAVSVGEIQAVEPVINALLEQHQEYSILITTTTPTGSAQVLELFGQEAVHVYAPYDLPDVVARFLGRIQPQLALVVETELWPNLFHACKKNRIPLLLINARLSEQSVTGYRRFRRLFSNTLAATTEIIAQGAVDAARFESLGADPGKITVAGNLKFEQRVPAELAEKAVALRREWGAGRPVWIAGSTHEGEDELVLDAFREVRRKVRDCLLVLVPRHPERFEAVAGLCRQRGYPTVLRSARVPCTPDTGVFIGDSMGELMLFYAAADVAFVGGSLVRIGGHNLLEPAASGVPVVTGQHIFNFAEICELLVNAGACRKVATRAELGAAVTRWLLHADERHLAGERGRESVEKNRGALETVLSIIEKYL